MTVRSPPLLALALACLVASAGLGTLLYHDGEIGATGALHSEDLGHGVRVKGNLAELQQPVGQLWPVLLTYTKVLHLEEQPDLLVLLSSDQPLPAGAVLVEGLLVEAGTLRQAPYVVIHASVVREPLVFA